MLNFSNLNDVEFEYLCKDVMSKILGIKLQRFGKGRDGGIDLVDDVYNKNIIVQVKHYVKTDIPGLISSLKKEIPKVKANRPKKYYICCSKELTPQNKKDIYEMFSDYMETTANIITLIEINDFLEKPDNADILHKHFKLWIESTNILTDIFTNDICIDSEALLCDIEESVNMFVKTSAFDQAISCLEKGNTLIIIGNPGVGKTMTSKMLVLYFAMLGFRVRYTSDGADLSALKKALSQSPDTKEVILLDDCFGQAYFRMKETQENELLALIKYIKMNGNKLLIMNSRVTIYREAAERTPNLVKSLDKKEYKAFVLDMTNVSATEKAKIFYNHLFFGGVPQLYLEGIKNGKNYKKIVNHINYNPRIIEFVTNKRQYEMVEPSKYSEFIIQSLKNPEQIWENEYERRLMNTDRILLNTLYSLTNTTISLDVVKKCYMHRISLTESIDSSINHFEQSVKRLQGSMIKIVDVLNKKMLSVSNPSINDFLSAHLEKNMPEKETIISTSVCIRQLKKLLPVESYKKELERIFADKSVLNYVFESEKQKIDFITYYCIENRVFDKEYKKYIAKFILSPHDMNIFEERKMPIRLMFRKLLEKDICLFYELNNIVCDPDRLKDIYSKLDLKEAVEFIRRIDYLFEAEMRENYVKLTVESLKEIIEFFYNDVQADEYDVDVGKIVDDYRYENENGWYINSDAAAGEIDDNVEEMVIDEIYECISELPHDIIIEQEFINKLSVSVSGSFSLVESYLRDDYSDYYYEEYRAREIDNLEMEYIFER